MWFPARCYCRRLGVWEWCLACFSHFLGKQDRAKPEAAKPPPKIASSFYTPESYPTVLSCVLSHKAHSLILHRRHVDMNKRHKGNSLRHNADFRNVTMQTWKSGNVHQKSHQVTTGGTAKQACNDLTVINYFSGITMLVNTGGRTPGAHPRNIYAHNTKRAGAGRRTSPTGPAR